ncbi:MAG: hypothetical protein L6407_04895 [Candidatus Delongbacteria bacterium]|nr:hypothetical protein [Candidatus Delongbacteria bacterium]
MKYLIEAMSVKKMFITLLFTCFYLIFSQETGLRKSYTDNKSEQTFNNFRTDSAQVIFYQVLKPDEFMYDEPKNNANAIYTLDSDIFVESVQESGGGSFIKIRVLDKFHGLIEGWVRSNSLKSMKFYGQSYTNYKRLPKSDNLDMDMKINPHWIKDNLLIVYSDSTLTDTAVGTLKKGDLVFVKKISPDDTSFIYFTNKEGISTNGYIKNESLSELALLDNSSTDFALLFNKYDPVLLRNDIDRAGFVSYNGIQFHNKDAKEFTEDKICRERSADTLYYRYSLSSNINDIKKKLEVKGRFDKANIAMYRFLPDENIVTTRDTIKCTVLELVNVPKSSKISANGIEDFVVTNSVIKLYITRIEKDNMDIVFQRESVEYVWSYSKNISTGEIIKSKTDTDKMLKRMVAFRKH